MLERKNLTLEELKEEHDQGRVYLFKGHIKEMSRMIEAERDKKTLTENDQKWPSLSYQGAIKRTISREKCSLEELAQKNLNKNVRLELDKMIREERQNVKGEKKMISIPKRRWNVGVRLATDQRVHLIDVVKLTGENKLILSNRTFCRQVMTHNDVVEFCNKITCKICLREATKK